MSQQQIQQLFMTMDTNRDGYVSKQELFMGMKRLQQTPQYLTQMYPHGFRQPNIQQPLYQPGIAQPNVVQPMMVQQPMVQPVVYYQQPQQQPQQQAQIIIIKKWSSNIILQVITKTMK